MSESDNKVGVPFAKQKVTLGVTALGMVGLVSWAGWTAFQGPSNAGVSPVASAFAANPTRRYPQIVGHQPAPHTCCPLLPSVTKYPIV